MFLVSRQLKILGTLRLFIVVNILKMLDIKAKLRVFLERTDKYMFSTRSRSHEDNLVTDTCIVSQAYA